MTDARTDVASATHVVANATSVSLAASVSAAEVPEADRALGEQLFIALGRTLRWNSRQSGEEFGPGVLSALGTVVDCGSMRLGDLAAREGVTPASLSRTIALLEAKGLSSRLVDPADRRSAFVRATDVGALLIRERRRDRGARIAAQLGPLTDEERAALQRIIAAISGLAD